MATTPTTSKIQLVYSPPLPATCAVCGKSADGQTPFIDFQKDLDYYGAVLFCTDCAKEMLTVIDFVPVADLEEAKGQLGVYANANIELREENERFRNVINAIVDLRSDLLPDSDPVDNVDDSSDADADGSSEDSESGPDESDTERGPEDISEPTDESKPSAQSKF